MDNQKLHAHQMASNWLYYANIAAERGNHALEQRHLARAQKWLDLLNLLDGLRTEDE
jgi:hypothetical protein